MRDGGSEGAPAHGIDFLDDPVLVVTLDGRVLEANASAMTFFGSRLTAGTLDALLADDAEACARYLRQASGSTSPRPGKFAFAGPMGRERFRTQAARSKRCDQAQIILRLVSAGSDRFAALDRRVKELDAQLHRRLQENEALQEALRQNQTLLRELQHRVKNNVQIMLSLITMAAIRPKWRPSWKPRADACTRWPRCRKLSIRRTGPTRFPRARSWPTSCARRPRPAARPTPSGSPWKTPN